VLRIWFRLGSATCFSFSSPAFQEMVPVFTDRKYSLSVTRTRDYLGLGSCYDHWRSRRFSHFSTSTSTYTPPPDWTLIFYGRSNFHTHRRTHYVHLRETTQFSRINETPPPITHCFDNETKLPGHRLMIPPSIQLATTSHLLRAPGEALQVVIICQISVLFQELSSETASRPKNLKT